MTHTPIEVILKLGEVIRGRGGTTVSGSAGSAGADTLHKFRCGRAKLIIHSADTLSNKLSRVEDAVTHTRGNVKGLATDDLGDDVFAASSREFGRRCCCLLGPVVPVLPATGCRRRGRADWLAVDIKDGESETEQLRVEVKVAEDWLVPCTVALSGSRPGRVPVSGHRERRRRFAFLRSADVGVCRRILLPVATDLRWRADGSWWTSPQVVARKRSLGSISRVDGPGGTSDQASQGR